MVEAIEARSRTTASLTILEGSLVLNRYRIVKALAQGGMGTVYLGRIEGAAGFSKPVVIKQVRSDKDVKEDSRAQFIQEARILSGLQHPNIVPVMDFGREGNAYFMILEYVHGYNLGHWFRYVSQTRGKLAWDHAVYIMIKVLAALDHAHTTVGPDGKPQGIIHRDVSPTNILIDLQGNVRLLDFGIAVDKSSVEEPFTRSGIIKGKLRYIAPETYAGNEASIVSDVYAAGVVLYQLLSGINPFAGKDTTAIVRNVLEVEPPTLASFRTDLPAMLDEVIFGAIAKDPKNRYANAREFSLMLRALLERTEDEIASDLRKVVEEDFTGDMPTVLNLVRLSELDTAWREAVKADRVRLTLAISSMPPPSPVPGDTIGNITLGDYPDIRIEPEEESSVEELDDGATIEAPHTVTGITIQTLIIATVMAALLGAAVALGVAWLILSPA